VSSKVCIVVGVNLFAHCSRSFSAKGGSAYAEVCVIVVAQFIEQIYDRVNYA
jgi:hypothetical protein